MESRKNPIARVLWNNTDKKKPKEISWMLETEKAGKTVSEKADDASTNAKALIKASAYTITATGIAMLGDRNAYFSLAPLGLPVAIGGLVLDTIKAPFCLVAATEESIRAGILKVASCVFTKDPTDAEIERIFKSFLIRMKDTAALLVALGLETENVLNDKLKSGDIEELVGLTLLHTAYASRRMYHGLLLATNKTLYESNCPEEGRELLKKIEMMKDLINQALNSANPNLKNLNEKDRELEESRIVCLWVKDIKAGKPLSDTDRPDANKEQLDIVNKIISQISALKQAGMQQLPEAPEKVAHQVNRRCTIV